MHSQILSNLVQLEAPGNFSTSCRYVDSPLIGTTWLQNAKCSRMIVPRLTRALRVASPSLESHPDPLFPRRTISQRSALMSVWANWRAYGQSSSRFAMAQTWQLSTVWRILRRILQTFSCLPTTICAWRAREYNNGRNASILAYTCVFRTASDYCFLDFSEWNNDTTAATSAQLCSDCNLRIQQAQLESPFGYDDDAASDYASLTSS